MLTIAVKQCRKCRTVKDASDFPRNYRLSGGLDSWCKACHSDAVMRSIAKKPDYYKDASATRRRAHQIQRASELASRAEVVRVSHLCGQTSPVAWLTCAQCSERYIRPRQAHGSRFCTTRCAGAFRRAHAVRPSNALARLVKNCAYCGTSFEGTPGRKFCEARCARRWHRDYNTALRRTRGSNYRADRVTRRQIAERDGWTCRLCLHPIDPSLPWPDPMSQSLDHILPIKHGGAHVGSNLQLAHLSCNSRKSARVDYGAAAA